jgi:hypothetical protein
MQVWPVPQPPAAALAPLHSRVCSPHVAVGSTFVSLGAQLPGLLGAGVCTNTLPTVFLVGCEHVADVPDQISEPATGCCVQLKTVSFTSNTFAAPVQLMPAAGSHSHLQLAVPGTRPALPVATLVP